MREISPVAGDPSWATSELEALVRRLLDLIGRVSGLESTYLTFIDWGGDEQHIVYARNDGALQLTEGLRVPWADTLCRRAIETGVDRTDDVAAAFPDSEAAAALGIRSYVSVPVTARDGAIFGTVCGASDAAITVSDDTMQIMRTLADMVSLQMRTDEASRDLAAANARLEELAHVDPLTGVGNRRAFEADLSRACSDALRRGVPVSVVTIDVDRFKQVNDTYGHGAGDDVLRAVADRVRTHTRAEDSVNRVGGDEFVVVLTGADASAAALVAGRIRDDLGGDPVATCAGPVSVSISVGVSSGTGAHPADLLHDSDAAMYAGKAARLDPVA